MRNLLRSWLSKGVHRAAAGTVSALMLAAVISGAALAWEQTFSSSPYNGWMTATVRSSDVVGTAQYIRWSSGGISAFNSDLGPRFDITADCAGTPGDQLDYAATYTNLPNSGVDVWNDCGSIFVREEAELWLTRTLVAEVDYYYQVIYWKQSGSHSGEINITYQRNNSPTHDWLDKATYVY